MKLLISVFLGLAVVNCAAIRSIERPQVIQLPYGNIRGTVTTGYAEYLNIPFAQPPVGPLRFRPPQLPHNISSVHDATAYGYSCMQTKNVSISEDCLNLNVYTPISGSNLPVLVYVYGGSFTSGSNSNPLFNGETILSYNQSVIIVTINYRVGSFGFLGGNLLSNENSVNVGLLDQKMAFEWVRNNIQLFGGDPRKVTAMGQSAGAVSLGAHLLAQSGTQQLFDRVVFLSGAPGLLYKSQKASEREFNNFASVCGCTSGDILSCLRDLPASDLLNCDSNLTFFPMLDGKYILEQTISQLSEQKASKVPVLLNDDLDEGTIFTYGKVQTNSQVLDYFSKFLPFLSNDQLQQLYSLYNPNSYPKGAFQAAADFFGDFMCQCPEILLATTFSKMGIETYRSSFTHVPLQPMFKGEPDIGVYHESELPFIWHNTNYLDSSEINLSDFMLDNILNFVHGSQPSPMWQNYGTGKRFNFVTQTIENDNERATKCSTIQAFLSQYFQQ
ncbi:Carboxylic ester hydrolase [Boothiomyces sp. JEL0866]|nr:Carboxylic ester hydrolase [Boothiomyces sp. JEL0866]